jgi:hypothetical protein
MKMQKKKERVSNKQVAAEKLANLAVGRNGITLKCFALPRPTLAASFGCLLEY